jgi:Pentapeptide repeats (8 copies)
MANEEHLARLCEGVEAWNQWRAAHRDIQPDLPGAHLQRAYLRRANLRGAILYGAHLGRGAPLPGGPHYGKSHRSGPLGADLAGANLHGVDLSEAHLSHANLAGACLERATLVETDFRGANLTGCQVYGIAAWNVNLVGAQQSDLVITAHNEPMITVDNLEVAQFIYLLLHNEKIREVIDTTGKKGVLILGRFAGERKTILEALRTALRSRGFLPMVFDFEKPTQ